MVRAQTTWCSEVVQVVCRAVAFVELVVAVAAEIAELNALSVPGRVLGGGASSSSSSRGSAARGEASGREAWNRGTSELEAALVARQLSAFFKVKNSQKLTKKFVSKMEKLTKKYVEKIKKLTKNLDN